MTLFPQTRRSREQLCISTDVLKVSNQAIKYQLRVYPVFCIDDHLSRAARYLSICVVIGDVLSTNTSWSLDLLPVQRRPQSTYTAVAGSLSFSSRADNNRLKMALSTYRDIA
jgi:hypothetical protein